MSLTFTGKKRIRKSFGRIPEAVSMPNLIEVQMPARNSLQAHARMEALRTAFLASLDSLRNDEAARREQAGEGRRVERPVGRVGHGPQHAGVRAGAVQARQQAEGEGAAPGSITVTIEPRGDAIVATVADNGRGLPDTERDRLTEPYVTTREKGTGLGLAIVKKIMEDHGGSIELRDRPEGGAAVSLIFSTPPTVLNETNPALAYHGQ